MMSIKAEIFNLDNSTQLEFLESQKQVVVIDRVSFYETWTLIDRIVNFFNISIISGEVLSL